MSIEIQAATPLMQQYAAIKSNFSDALLLFQVGDFYEFFYEDAKIASAFLAITLTARGKNNGDPIPLCGVPVHAADYYIAKLVKGGFKVALCNQLEPAVPGRVVDRGVAHVFTPGTLTDANLLDDKSASYLFSFFPTANSWGLLFAELMTAQLHATVLDHTADKTLDAELSRFLPDEIIIPSTKLGKTFEPFFEKRGYFITTIVPQAYEQSSAHEWVKNQFNPDSQNHITTYESLRNAVANFYWYLKKNQELSLPQFNQIQFYQPEDFLIIDAATQRNLELVKNMQDGGRKNTLYEHLDHAATAMGSRTIKKWILRPLIKKEAISARHAVIEKLIYDVQLTHTLKKMLSSIGDLERVVGRIMVRRATLHDFNGLTQSLEVIPSLQSIIAVADAPALLQRIAHQLGNFSALKQLLDAAFNIDSTREWIIKAGFDQRLDHVRKLVDESTTLLTELEQREQQKTGINSLKVRYNQMYGYYIEITKANSHLVPDYFIRSQSLVGKERFTTTELRALEAEMLIARSQIQQLEKEVFETVKREVAQYGAELRKMAFALAHLDALFGLSILAYNNGYVRPTFNDRNEIIIKEGKHPVISHHLAHRFISNNTALTNEQSLFIITGPNMGGKSTYLRQVALITIMAQLGSFVSAQEATIALRDRIFTRIGAGDNVAGGKSTFLVEMEETAHICLQATEQSLVILDEIGRGTSTFDGLAIAQAVVEYLYTVIKARCLFATHYHELTALQEQFSGIACYYAASKKTDDGIILLYNIVEGIADGSFGVEVAKLAHIPLSIINRAQEILEALDAGESSMKIVPAQHAITISNQLSDGLVQENKKLVMKIVDLENKMEDSSIILKNLAEIDYESLSPKKAFDILWDLHQKQK
jgi:DNA mismatch repair protein MutS